MGLIDDLRGSIDSILGVRDSIGAVLKPVFLVTRTWYQDAGFTTEASAIGGYARDEEIPLLPSPGIKRFMIDERIRQGGVLKQGDVLLQNVSAASYTAAMLDGSSSAGNVEKLYRVGDTYYQVVNVTEKYATFDVLLRKIADQTGYA